MQYNGDFMSKKMPSENVIDDLSNKAQRILGLVKAKPGITAKEIQKNLDLESGHTFGRHIKQLLKNNLVRFEVNKKDKRQKNYFLTPQGDKIQELFTQYYLKISLKYFFEYCEDLFLANHSEYLNSEEWRIFQETYGYSDELVRNLEQAVFSYTAKCLKEIEQELPFQFSRDAIETSISRFESYYKHYYQKAKEKNSLEEENDLIEKFH